jgi:hypothetical protein
VGTTASRASATDRRIGWLAVLGGLALALAAQVHAPIRVPLFDGVVVQEPYRYLHPTGGQAGNPLSDSHSIAVQGGVSPIVSAFTAENPTQAQLVAQKDAFELPPGTTSIDVSITPIEPPPPPAGSSIAGNVYRFAVGATGGAPLAIKACSGCVSLTLRAPDDVGEATLQRYAGGQWTVVETIHVPLTGGFQANPKVLGDYALIVAGEPAAAGPDTVLILGGVALVLLLAGIAFLFFRVRPANAPIPVQPPGSRVPSKRKSPRRPSGGRSNR